MPLGSSETDKRDEETAKGNESETRTKISGLTPRKEPGNRALPGINC